ncbi:type I-E CRISPR-associated protein Cas6/Cse3/CasE [Aquidulcibacter paucihalophilus]|uniref:type I-E CRISPR-associated protein Cas6/Cse3/CasE n=1 Tax=Aquidulcibacter paucihalophilus TaxID=1978549 RepID=UPI000A19189D|nr:type I-E CRISPR-associated protein Cas6/Cse3/CasE [Aquidulcibacter paucihalophilus]
MSAPLTLVRMVPDMRALAQAAAGAGFVPTGGDMGYALHAALLAIFGPELAPKTFTLRDGTVMGYSAASPEDLLTAVHLQPASMEALAQALGPHHLEARTMPQNWRVDQELDLEVRIRPIVRSRAGRGRAKGGRELDAFVMNAPPKPTGTDAAGTGIAARELAYCNWLRGELDRGGASSLLGARMRGFQRTRLLTRPKVEHSRSTVTTEGPDAVMYARIRIKDPASFDALLRRGIGRHRAFGFGMMLLSPPGRLFTER